MLYGTSSFLPFATYTPAWSMMVCVPSTVPLKTALPAVSTMLRLCADSVLTISLPGSVRKETPLSFASVSLMAVTLLKNGTKRRSPSTIDAGMVYSPLVNCDAFTLTSSHCLLP